MEPTHEEVWRPVVGYEGAYEVSNLGRVRSLDRWIERVTGARQRLRGRILSIQFDGRYESVRLKLGGAGRTVRVHQLVTEAFIGPRPDGMEVCHDDGDPRNNRVDNLRYDTHAANSQDRIKHGTQARRADSAVRCYRGHEYQSEADYYINSAGVVKCLICDRERGERYRASKRNGPKRSDRMLCKNGHPFDGIAKKSGGGTQRTCSICRKECERRFRERKAMA